MSAHQLGDGLRHGVPQGDVMELVVLADLFGHRALPRRRRTQHTHPDGLQHKELHLKFWVSLWSSWFCLLTWTLRTRIIWCSPAVPESAGTPPPLDPHSPPAQTHSASWWKTAFGWTQLPFEGWPADNRCLLPVNDRQFLRGSVELQRPKTYRSVSLVATVMSHLITEHLYRILFLWARLSNPKGALLYFQLH